MSEKLIRKSLELTLDQWQQLDRLANEHQALGHRGPGHNRPSWRILIRQIAEGQLTINTKEQNR